MAASDEVSVAHIYKRKYSDRQVADMAERDHPYYASIDKPDGFDGEAHYYAMTYGRPQGVSGTFADAQAAASSSKGKQLRMEAKVKYGVITLGGVAMMKARGNEGSFLKLVSLETDGIIREMGDSLAFDLPRSGNGVRGRIASLPGGNVIQLGSGEARNFKIDMTIIGDDVITGATPNAGSTTVTNIDEDADRITVANLGAANLIVNDYLFRKGDPGTCVEGLSLHLPLTAPSVGESWRGIDRSSHTRLLAGVRISDTSVPLEESIGLSLVKTRSSSSDPGKQVFYANPIRVFEVARRQNAKVTFQGAGGTATWGFQTIKIETPYGMCDVVADPDFPLDLGYLVSPADQYLHRLDEIVHIIRDDGKPSMRQVSADGIETRGRSISNLAITRPAAFAVVAIGS